MSFKDKWNKLKAAMSIIDEFKITLFNKNENKIAYGNQDNSKTKNINKQITNIINTYNLEIPLDNKELLLKFINDFSNEKKSIIDSIPDNWEPKNIEEYNEMNNLIKKGIEGPNERAKYISLAIKKLSNTNENEFSYKKNDLDKTIEFLVRSNNEQKSFIVWSYILSIIDVGINSVIIKEKIDILRKEFPLKNSKIIIGSYDFLFFAKFMWKPDANIHKSKEKILKYIDGISEFMNEDSKNIGSYISIYYYVPIIPIILQDAAIFLLKEIGFDFKD